MDIFTSITPYHWIALGLILLTAEILGTAGFLLGAAIAAFAMSTVVWLMPELNFGWQLALYAIAAIVASVVYFQVFRDAQNEPARPLLNKRAKRLIGHQFRLQDDIEFGEGKVQIGDTFWQVKSAKPLSKGTLVEVVDTQRMQLVIAAK
jgi:inner membrane protein